MEGSSRMGCAAKGLQVWQRQTTGPWQVPSCCRAALGSRSACWCTHSNHIHQQCCPHCIAAAIAHTALESTDLATTMLLMLTLVWLVPGVQGCVPKGCGCSWSGQVPAGGQQGG